MPGTDEQVRVEPRKGGRGLRPTPQVIRRLEKWVEREARPQLPSNVSRARELRLAGKTTREIARELGVTERTVRNYRRKWRTPIDLQGCAIVDRGGMGCIEAVDGLKLPLLAIRVACPVCETSIYGTATRAEGEFIVNCPL